MIGGINKIKRASVTENITLTIISFIYKKWEWGDLNPHDRLRSTDFHSLAAFATSLQVLRIGLSLYPRLNVRVAPVESLHLPGILTLKFEFWI